MIDIFWNTSEPAPRGHVETVAHPRTGAAYERLSSQRIIVCYGDWVGESWWNGHHWVKLPVGAEPDAWMPLPGPLKPPGEKK